MMPSRSNLSGSSTPPSANSPNSQVIRPLRRWSRMLSLNLRMPPFTPVDQVAEEADRSLDDVAHHTGHPGEHVHQHRRELANRVDDGLDCADRLVDQALVLGLQFLDALVETLAGFDVLRSQGVDDGLLLGVDVVLQLLELVGDLLGRLRANLLQARRAGSSRTRRSRSCRPRSASSPRSRSSPTMLATREMTPSICLRYNSRPAS